jgi:hypothetical protein
MSLFPRAALAAVATAAICLGQGVSVPFVDQLDAPGFPGAGWTITTTDPVGRIQLVAPSVLSPAGGLAAQFDVSTSNIFSTNALTLGVDLSGGGTFVLKYWAREVADETHVEDGLFLAATPAGPFVKVVDHATLTATWIEISVDLTAAAAANGLALGSNFQVRFQQRDNFPAPSDGLQIDSVRIESVVTGQANAADAGFDVNNGLNGFGQAAGPGVAGPFFASGAPGAALVFEFTGPPNRPYALLAGPLNIGNLSVPPFGSLDIGLLGANLSDVVIILDGTQPGYFNALANTGPAGVSTLQLAVPSLPPGVWTAFQALVFVDAVTAKLTAAFEFTVL